MNSLCFPGALTAMALLPFSACAQTTKPMAPAPAARAVVLPETVIGRSVVNPREELEVTYTVFATQPMTSQLTGQKIRLEKVERGLRDVTLDNGQVIQRRGMGSRSLAINTGRHMTVGRLGETVGGFLRRFASGAVNPPGLDLGKIGDARYGGEMHFVAETSDRLRIDYVPNEVRPENAVRFSPADADAFAKLLGR